MTKQPHPLKYAVVMSGIVYATFILRQHAIDWTGYLRGEDGGDYHVKVYNKISKMYEVLPGGMEP